MAQSVDKQNTAEQQKILDFIDEINAKVNACGGDWNKFEDLCWGALRGLNLWMHVGAVDPGTKKPTTYEKLSLDQILSEIDGTPKTIYSYLREHKQTSNGDHEIELRGHNKDRKGSVKWAKGPTINLKKQVTSNTTAKPKGPTAATPTPTSSLTKDILTALPSMVSAFQLLQPKQNNNDNKLILDFMKMQQENAHREQERLDRLESQRRAD